MSTMPAGRYFVGDLCYVMHDVWDEVCDLMFPNSYNGKVEVLPAKLADQLGDLIEALEDECYFQSMEEEATDYA